MPFGGTVQLTFLRDWSGHLAGATHDIEATAARLLISHGYAEPADSAPETDLVIPDVDEPAQSTDSPDTGATEKEA
jgi:hypothetical protein